ncbi:MAG: hypothetical protein QM654_11035, partial [Dysgonamonadaceae bacterium]
QNNNRKIISAKRTPAVPTRHIRQHKKQYIYIMCKRMYDMDGYLNGRICPTGIGRIEFAREIINGKH